MKRLLITLITVMAFVSIPATGADKMNAKVRSINPELQKSVFENPEENLKAFVFSLTGGAKGQSEKVRLIHDWICDNIAYDADMYLSGKLDSQDYIPVLKKKKGVCSGYVNVMNEMCHLAGIESVSIYGYSKGFGYSGNIKAGQDPDHAWNAVKIGDSWKLVDATWDAGYMDYKTFIKHYSLEWYLTPPKNWLYSHLPLEDEWQLVPEKDRKSIEKFVKEPYVGGKFFSYALSFIGTEEHPMPLYDTIIESETEFVFNVSKSGVELTASIAPQKGGQEVLNATWTSRKGKTLILNADVPDNEEYKAVLLAKYASEVICPGYFEASDFEGRVLAQVANLVAKKKVTQKESDLFAQSYFLAEENNRYYFDDDQFATTRNAAVFKVLKLFEERYTDNILDFNIKAALTYKGFGKGVVKYPTQYLSYGKATNTALISPLLGVLHKGKGVDFAVTSGDFVSLAVHDGNNLTQMTKDAKTKTFELHSYVISDSAEKIIVLGSKDGRRYEGLWFYEVAP